MASRKICDIKEIDELREAVIASGDLSCAKCCARSNDASRLCDPVVPPNKNLFCECCATRRGEAVIASLAPCFSSMTRPVVSDCASGE